MRHSHRPLHILGLILLLLASCNAPDSRSLTVTATPGKPDLTSLPGQSTSIASSPTSYPISPRPTLTPGIAAQLPSTPVRPSPSMPIEEKCKRSEYKAMSECIIFTQGLPPRIPFEQALQKFSGHILLFTRRPSLLMIGDPDTGETVWISASFCDPHTALEIYAEWSADGQFIASICHDSQQEASIHVIDLHTGSVNEVARGYAVDFRWSPQGHHLLIAQQTMADSRHSKFRDELIQDYIQTAMLLDLTNHTTAALVNPPLWENTIYIQAFVGQVDPYKGWGIRQGKAAMAWSPDGTKITTINSIISVFDANTSHAHKGQLSMLTSFEATSISAPLWSHDGRFLYTHEIGLNSRSPVSGRGNITQIRRELSTGAITHTNPLDLLPRWSPDSQVYLERQERFTGNWTLHKADGTLIKTLENTNLSEPIWAPDSQHVLFSSGGPENNRMILVDLSGHAQTIVHTQDNIVYWSQNPSPISADSQLFAFSTYPRNGEFNDRTLTVYDSHGQVHARFVGYDVLGWRFH